MGFLDRLLGRDDEAAGQQAPAQAQAQAPGGRAPARSDDEIAVERYRYLLRTAPPETIEQVHAEAFEKLSPEQRRMVFDELSREAGQGEQPRGDDAGSLAQAATRSELRKPGTLERTLGGGGAAGGPGQQAGGRPGMGMGSIIGGSLLGTVAGYVVGSALVGAFLPDASSDVAGGAGDGGDGDGGDGGDGGQDTGDGGAAGDGGGDAGDGGGDFGGGDFGGGGGDFGGGDFGGGDLGGFDI
ncbi:hypothetical protein ABID92_002225 [Frigoribacterium sp. PvP120]|uniref:hypothetical protein n=1 Tax=unclassified Frigoribacterium TaxID=2627005 RepID=UPI001AE1F720|nr:hypothetical protein [Frigoribacterium sp. PvP121]MBP1242433.1 hypothetical protein [Frigoribacterium sp. PvP121]